MRRRHNGFVPDGGRRRRKHHARNLHGSHRENRQRDLYRRLVDRVRLELDPRAKEVLLVLVDRREAGPTLRDVCVTQQQIVDLLAGGKNEPQWGWSLTAIRRLIRHLVDDGWLSIEDVDLPQGGWQMNCYRFHVPEPYLPLWRLLCDQAETSRQEGETAARAARASGGHQQPRSGHDRRPAAAQGPSADDDPEPPASRRRYDADGVRQSRERLAARLRNRAGP